MIKSLHTKIVLLFSLFFVLSSVEVSAQKTVLDQNFNTSSGAGFTASGSIPGSIWNVSRSGADFGAKIDQGLLTLSNDASSTRNSNGWVRVSTLNSEFGENYKPTLNQNVGVVSWSFNMRQSETKPNGFGNGEYGITYILAGTENTTNSLGQGFAVRLGFIRNSPDRLRVVRYGNGLNSWSTILSGQDSSLSNIGTGFISVRVEYDPKDNSWALYARRDNNGTFPNPAEGEMTLQEKVVYGTTLEDTPLNLTGTLWNAGAAANATAVFDNVSIRVAVPE